MFKSRTDVMYSLVRLVIAVVLKHLFTLCLLRLGGIFKLLLLPITYLPTDMAINVKTFLYSDPMLQFPPGSLLSD